MMILLEPKAQEIKVWSLDSEAALVVAAVYNAGHKIAAIKLLREHFIGHDEIGLRDAKLLTDQIAMGRFYKPFFDGRCVSGNILLVL